MALTAAQRNRLNTFLVALRDLVIAKQDAYHDGTEVLVPASKDEGGKDVPAVTRQRERYVQLRRQLLSSVNFADKPTDQKETWADVGIATLADLPDKTGLDALSVQIDTYDGPQGKGWQAVFSIELGGTTYQRTYNRGPEAYRDQDWVEVKKE